ncbi:MAG: TIGR01244 family sulfur transferase [Kordiimonas sp.]
MSQFRKLTEQVSVSPQITTADIDEAAASGVELIINNRPDGEEMGQPTNDELSAYAEGKGIKWAHIPIVSGQVTMEAISITSSTLRDADKILAYCRSGTRSCNMWGLAVAYAGSEETTDIITKAEAAGYDLSGMASTFKHLHGTED